MPAGRGGEPVPRLTNFGISGVEIRERKDTPDQHQQSRAESDNIKY
jgi:hypothetical protein